MRNRDFIAASAIAAITVGAIFAVTPENTDDRPILQEKIHVPAGNNGVADYPEGWEFVTTDGRYEVTEEVYNKYQQGDRVTVDYGEVK